MTNRLLEIQKEVTGNGSAGNLKLNTETESRTERETERQAKCETKFESFKIETEVTSVGLLPESFFKQLS